MKNLFIVASLLAVIFALEAPSPPSWPQTFSQDFVSSFVRAKAYESARLWYDYTNNRERVDYSGSRSDLLCSAVGQDYQTPCSIVVVNKTTYVNLPQQSKCCKCCTEADGCTITSKDYLKDFKFSGEATINDQTFYKWTLSGLNYYETEDAQRIPRRFDGGQNVIDFIMNTFSTDKIQDSVYQLPSVCNTPCPKTSFCASSLQQSNQNKLTRKSFFSKNTVQSLIK